MRGAAGTDADTGTRRALERQSWSKQQGKPPTARGRANRLGCEVGAVGRLASSPGHLQVKDQGKPLQVLGVFWLEGVGPSQVLGGRREVTELDVGLSS